MYFLLRVKLKIEKNKPCEPSVKDDHSPITLYSLKEQSCLTHFFVPITWIDESGWINGWMGYACI